VILCGTTVCPPAAFATSGDAEAWRARNDEAVAEFRLANRAATTAEARRGLERALALLDGLLDTPPPDPASEHRARFDRIVVLAALGRNEAALHAVADLEAEGVALPAYVLSSAGDATASQGDAEGALRRYEAALALDPAAEAAHAGRIFALSDLDRLDRAGDILRRRLATSQPAEVRRDDRLRLALVTAWSGRLDRALSWSAELLAEHPDDAELLVQHGGLLLQADRPRAALRAFAGALELEPGSRRAAVGRAQSLVRLARWREAEAAFGEVAAEDPEWLPLARARREVDADRAAQVSWDARRGTGPDREIADQELRWEARATSARFGGGWRAFAGRREAEAERSARTLRDERTFAGLSLQRGDWRLRGEADRADDPSAPLLADDGGWTAGADWRPGDPWSLAVEYSDDAFDLPLRAREQGVTGDRVGAAVRWQPRAQHALRLSTSHVDYTDDNRSRSLGLSASSHWPFGRRNRLVLEPGVYASRQDRQDVAYYSPSRDLSLEVAGAVEQRLWSSPGRRLRHALELGVGLYRQEGFDAEATGRLGYRVEWDFAPSSRVYLRLARLRRAYDGAPEHQTRVEVGGWWAWGGKRPAQPDP